ncbi:phosphoinositide phosphatase Pten/Tep1, putative [Talaromyces stipitatus ATCC 10500]|uniref:phosphatidylinositol-3,4,5-trisphosphate 3-phosphatase n=1 Tax=Talaromyces stipitatus (strain ATCC 10500 / CBS 375.48 / QM 6759 / NRRL 1006) TaxID=441959 RepID=B8MLJ5_TALSN|nr:phosphoinositide phosphatase Pten/Tep1, putative [Talaromyces stipitatus ATCC 10500]EED15528.1 phosphoinositide phosphatase Pten/Tep1, putative [Talaromyces stipitatus ATCC 10500]
MLRISSIVIATSGPSSKYPKRAYRNPTDALVRFLDSKHGEDWAIWEFRAEGTGYPDSEVYDRIHHFPWPDHHPPPFSLIPAIMGSMRNWLHGETPGDEKSPDNSGEEKKIKKKRVAVVHCKAGKGRSGTVACSYLISQEGWKMEDALQRFTERRMRIGFGEGVSIPSQLRYVRYVNKWANEMGKVYVERPVEILEVHVWGLRDGVKIALEGYVDEGKKIKCFHLFRRKERIVVDDGKNDLALSHNDFIAKERLEKGKKKRNASPSPSSSANSSTIIQQPPIVFTSSSTSKNVGDNNKRIAAAILRPEKPVILPTSDVNIDFERRIKAAYTGWAMVTSIAHVWFNAYFEGGDKHDSGIFECDWDGLDGIKGSTSKGTKALERVKIVWRYASKEQLAAEGKETAEKLPEEVVMTLPKPGEPVHESHAADWHGENVVREDEREMEFSEQNPTSSPARHHTRERSVHKPEDADEKGEKISGATNPFIAQASATTVAAVTLAMKRVRRELGLRKQTDASAEVSLASSSAEDLSSSLPKRQEQKRKEEGQDGNDSDSDMEGVKPYLEGEGNGSTNTNTNK